VGFLGAFIDQAGMGCLVELCSSARVLFLLSVALIVEYMCIIV